MYTLNIEIKDREIQDFITHKYGSDQPLLMDDILELIRAEMHISKLKKSFDEVADFENGKTDLISADQLLSELKSEYQNN